jgi:hypothetical protein
MSGLDAVTDFAISFNRVVLPAFGWETIIPRCPLPIGEIRSTILIATLLPGLSKRILSLGKIGVRSSKFFLCWITLG